MSEGKAPEAPQETTWAFTQEPLGVSWLPGSQMKQHWLQKLDEKDEPTRLGTGHTVLSISVAPVCPWVVSELHALENIT